MFDRPVLGLNPEGNEMRTTTLMALAMSVLAYLPAAAQDWSVVTIPNSPRVLDMDIEGQIVWMATEHSGLIGYDDGTWVLHLSADGGIRSDHWNNAVFVDASGDKWIGRDLPNAVDRLDDAGTFYDKSDDTWTYYTYQVELENKRPFSMTETASGDMWFGMRDESHLNAGTVEFLIQNDPDTTSDDVWFHYDNAWTPDSTSFSDDDVRSVAVDGGGRLWIGYYSSGVDVWDYGDPAVFSDDDWVHYSAENGLPSDLVQALHVDAKGRVWVGTASGLAVYEPASGSLREVNALQGLAVSALDADAHGHIWAATDEGVAMLYGNGTVAALYGVSDGIPGESVSEIGVDRGSGIVWAIVINDNTQATNLCRFESGYGSSIGDVFVYPNPWKEGGDASEVTLYGVPEGSRVTVMDILGEEVRKLRPTEPYVWDTLDSAGSEVPSGVYVIRVEATDGAVSFTKAAVIR